MPYFLNSLIAYLASFRNSLPDRHENMSTSSLDERMMMSRLMLDDTRSIESSETSTSLNACYNERIRPLLDAVDKLRNLDIMKEGIELPSIVVVSDQSSGKSSVLESLAGISLPKGQGICTRVPLIMRLQSCATKADSEILIEYSGIKRHIAEYEITEALNSATDEIAGESKGISNTPITLHVRKLNAPDLTMVDLPGITRVPVHGQPENIYEQISEIIMHYITPKESIILNVLAANVDFPTCESIRMSRRVDGRGERTLAVVTKADKAPEGLLEKVTVDAVNIGLGYVCVSNAIGNESNKEARKKEAELFASHQLLRKIDKSMVGIPVLAKKLMQIQAGSINKFLPDIVKKIDATLSKRQSELTQLPQHLCNPSEANVVFIKLMNSIKDSLNKILIQGDFEQFSEKPRLHCTARLREMFENYYRDLCKTGSVGGAFLVNESKMLEEAKGVGLPNFLPRPVFLNLLQKLIDEVSEVSLRLAFRVWDYLEDVILHVIDLQTQNYPALQSATRRAVQALILKKRNECVEYVKEMLEMEKCMDFTLTPIYMQNLNNLLKAKDPFLQNLCNMADAENRGRHEWQNDLYNANLPYQSSVKKTVAIDGIGELDVSEALAMDSDRVEEAYDMQMSVVAYWKVVILRLGDGIPLRLQFVSRNLVKIEVDAVILSEVGGPRFNTMEKILEESPAVAHKRKSLTNSVDLLRDSKTALANIMDRMQNLDGHITLDFL